MRNLKFKLRASFIVCLSPCACETLKYWKKQHKQQVVCCPFSRCPPIIVSFWARHAASSAAVLRSWLVEACRLRLHFVEGGNWGRYHHQLYKIKHISLSLGMVQNFYIFQKWSVYVTVFHFGITKLLKIREKITQWHIVESIFPPRPNSPL